ncbi:MAG: hypothetical protein IKO23_05280 [Bacteroidales bacterium]|nr:hypothetical protein [Bacteroidales bacterium]MBR6828006.1 hypothetical protein [Prevotella sp.]
MKKRIQIFITTLILLLAGAAQAQVFTMTEEENDRAAGDMDAVLGRIPYHGVDYDQANDFAPVGEGMLLLTALGGCYLLGKRKKEE